MAKYLYMMLKAAKRALFLFEQCPFCFAANETLVWASKRHGKALAEQLEKLDCWVPDGCVFCPLRAYLHDNDLIDSCAVHGRWLLEKYEQFFNKE